MGLEDAATKQLHDLDIKNARPNYNEDVPELDKILEERKPMGMVQFMLENGLTEVPERFIQPPQVRMSQTPSIGDGAQIPLIDLSRFGSDEEGSKQVVTDLSNACSEWGFVQVVNHGVPPAVMDAMMDITKKFFTLPAEEKEAYKINKVSGCGYGRLFEVDEGVTADWNDRFYATSYGDDQKKTDALPPLTNPPGFQETLDQYGEAVYGLLKKMLSILSMEVGQAPEFFYEKIGGELAGLRTALNFYPPCPEPDLVMGLSPHADAASVMTFVQQGGVDGLEVLKDGVWVPVKPIPHAFVINIGDLLQMISNGKFRSVLHRAHCTLAHAGRFSISSFTLPNRDAIVQPAKELCRTSKPPLYKSVKFHDFLIEFCMQKLGPRFIKQYELYPDVE